MASITVIVWEIVDSYDSPYVTQGYADGNFIHCILDDVALTLSVQIRSSSQIGEGTLVASPSDGPGLFQDGGISSNNFPGTPTPQPFWSRCDGTTLQRISPNNQFPYASLGSTPNSSQCQVTPVCDLTIDDEYSVTPASGPSTADGAVTISATSSNGTIRYSLTAEFDYATGQTSTTFATLLPGSYTIYAKDPIGCTDEIMITIPVTTVYGVKYRCEYGLETYRNVPQTSRIDILERGYTGEVIEFCSGPNPFRLIYKGSNDNKYHPVWYSDAEIQLRSDVSLQWQELFTSDDKKYLVKFYRDEGGFDLKWTGFIKPSLYSEPYLATPFIVSVTASDNIQLLKSKDFLDDNGNELRQVVSKLFLIAMILRKTGLNISIRSCIDILEASMDATADDDVLPQAFIDSRIFYSDSGSPMDCEKVLTHLLEDMGAYIKSGLGYYWIIRQERSVGDIDYRQFDSDGDFESSGTFESLYQLVHPDNLGSVIEAKLAWRERQQILQFQPNYGVFRIIHDLKPDNNLIDSGSFEEQYITETGGQLGFIDWNVFLGQAGLRYGFESVKNGDSRGAFYFDLENANVAQVDNILYSKKLRVFNSLFDFSFDYYVEPEFTNFPFVRIAYQIKASQVGGATVLYLDKFGRWDGSGTAHINDIYVTDYLKWQSFQQRIPDFPSVNDDGWDVELKFYSHNHYGADVSDTDFSELKDIATAGQYTSGKRVYRDDTSATNLLQAYELRNSFETESTPDRVRPDDYSSPSNQKVWFLTNTINVGSGQSFVRKVLFDNVVFNQLVLVLQPTTFYTEAPETGEYELTTDEFNLSTLEKTVLLGDSPSGESGVIQATIPNPEVYRSWIRLSDGTPTSSWFRIGVTEDRLLLEILLNDYAAQLRDPTYRLDGTVLANKFLSPIHSVEDTDEDDKRYIILGYDLDDKSNSYRITLAQVITGTDGETPPDDSEFTEEFTTEFIS